MPKNISRAGQKKATATPNKKSKEPLIPGESAKKNKEKKATSKPSMTQPHEVADFIVAEGFDTDSVVPITEVQQKDPITPSKISKDIVLSKEQSPIKKKESAKEKARPTPKKKAKEMHPKEQTPMKKAKTKESPNKSPVVSNNAPKDEEPKSEQRTRSGRKVIPKKLD